MTPTPPNGQLRRNHPTTGSTPARILPRIRPGGCSFGWFGTPRPLFWAFLVAVALLPKLVLADPVDWQRFESAQTHMGSKFTIVVYAAAEPIAEQGFQAAFERIRQLDATLSDYQAESELSRLSESSPTPSPVPVGADLFQVLKRSQEISVLSEGAFDVTVGPLTKLWRRARRQNQLPPEDLLRTAREAVGFSHLQLDPETRTAHLRRPGMRLDLGGIAKGFAADEALAVLRKSGLTSALVNAGGGMALGDPPPGEKGWSLGIAPLDPDEPPHQFLSLANCGVATSGDARQHLEIDGIRYSHILDPRTGRAITHRSSVTVVAQDGMTADALATALSVLGTQGVTLAENIPGTAALVVTLEADRPQTVMSRSFQDYLKPDASR